MAHHGGAQGIALIDTSNGNVIGTLSDEASTTALSLAFSPDGSLLASGDYDNSVTLWDVGTRQRIGSRLRSTNLWVTPGKFSPWIQSIVFSPDGEWIATGSHDQTVRLWDISIDHIHICALANRNFTDTEWRAVMGDATYHRTCPDLPDGQGAGN